MKKIASVERFRDMSILITGGVGFIGSHITERLAAKNHITDVELRIPKSCNEDSWL
ncbi:MAG TPA: NAD-dependent epimerase/dehydratase family protein [Candidatus Bathyarchaeia archaeon]|nr:NAD-dependent epimerase/dehydratase family protein [Candidatus Bathyarchaeia archaeon]